MSIVPRPLLTTLMLGILLPCLSASSAVSQTADDPSRPWRVDLFSSLAYGDIDGFESSPWGLRTSYQPNGPWAYELSVTEVSLRFSDSWVADVSAKRILGDPGRANWYLLAGAGYRFTENARFPLSDGDGAGLHFGSGVDIQLSDRLSLRPEARARWFDGSNDAYKQELTIGLGWRF